MPLTDSDTEKLSQLNQFLQSEYSSFKNFSSFILFLKKLPFENVPHMQGIVDVLCYYLDRGHEDIEENGEKYLKTILANKKHILSAVPLIDFLFEHQFIVEDNYFISLSGVSVKELQISQLVENKWTSDEITKLVSGLTFIFFKIGQLPQFGDSLLRLKKNLQKNSLKYIEFLTEMTSFLKENILTNLPLGKKKVVVEIALSFLNNLLEHEDEKIRWVISYFEKNKDVPFQDIILFLTEFNVQNRDFIFYSIVRSEHLKKLDFKTPDSRLITLKNALLILEELNLNLMKELFIKFHPSISEDDFWRAICFVEKIFPNINRNFFVYKKALSALENVHARIWGNITESTNFGVISQYQLDAMALWLQAPRCALVYLEEDKNNITIDFLLKLIQEKQLVSFMIIFITKEGCVGFFDRCSLSLHIQNNPYNCPCPEETLKKTGLNFSSFVYQLIFKNRQFFNLRNYTAIQLSCQLFRMNEDRPDLIEVLTWHEPYIIYPNASLKDRTIIHVNRSLMLEEKTFINIRTFVGKVVGVNFVEASRELMSIIIKLENLIIKSQAKDCFTSLSSSPNGDSQLQEKLAYTLHFLFNLIDMDMGCYGEKIEKILSPRISKTNFWKLVQGILILKEFYDKSKFCKKQSMRYVDTLIEKALNSSLPTKTSMPSEVAGDEKMPESCKTTLADSIRGSYVRI